MNIDEIVLSRDEDVRELATRIGKDIGGISNLTTANKESVVSAINEVYAAVNGIEVTPGEEYALKSDLTPLATKAEVAEDIGNLTNLPTSDKTSVVASINEVVDNVATTVEAIDTAIDAVYTEVDSVYAKKSELTPLATKAELTPLATKAELTPLATKAELTQAITDLINGADADSDTLKELADKITALAQADNGLVSALEAQEFTVEQEAQARSNIDAASTSELEAQKVDLLEDIATATAPLATKEELEAKAEKAPEGDEYALVSSLPDLVAPYATKAEVTQAFTDLGDNAGGDYVSAYLQASQQTGE